MPPSLVIVNPRASRIVDAGRRSALIAQIDRALERRDGVRPEVIVAGSAEAIAGHVRAAVAAGASTIVGVGGDGTLREIAAVIGDTDVELGVIPAGTGNVLAGVLGVPSRLSDAAAALTTARSRRIDLGVVAIELAPPASSWAQVSGDGVPGSPRLAFIIGCGIGFDARVVQTTPASLKRRLGRAAYLAQAAWLATGIGAVPYRVTIDGEAFEMEASIALVANLGELISGVVGPRLPILPDDGLLDVFVAGARGPIAGARALLDHLARTRPGQNPGAGTLRARGRHVVLRSTPPEPLQVDGDAYGPGALEAWVRPGALAVLVPPLDATQSVDATRSASSG